MNGGTTYEPPKFGDLDGLSDDEIIELAKAKSRERFDATKQSAIDETNGDIEIGDQDVANAGPDTDALWLSIRQDFVANAREGQKVNEAAEYQEPVAVPYKLKIETDGTGNNTAVETLSFEYEGLNGTYFYAGSNIGSSPDRYADQELYKTTGVSIDLYSPSFSTYSIVYNTAFGGFNGLATVVDEGTAGFTWDTPQTAGVEVD